MTRSLQPSLTHVPTSRVLLAEDNPVHRSLVRSMLEQLGCRVDVAANGIEAVDSFATSDYDLVFMDWRMPGLDGVEATRRIRDAEQERAAAGRSRVPIIALTAHVLPGDRSRCLSAGMDDYLAKPVSRRNLGLMLDKWAPPVVSLHASPGTEGNEASAVHDAVLDPNQIAELAAIERDGAPGLVVHLIETYLGDAPAKLQLLQTAAAEGDALGVQVATHSFKSASSTVGAHRLYRLCNDLESDARALRLDHVQTSVTAIITEYQIVANALDALRAELGERDEASTQ